MPDLIVHIGLPKTGTTTIQNLVLRGVPGYLGKLLRDQTQEDLGKQLATAARLSMSAQEAPQVDSWVSRAVELSERRWPNTQRLIVSDENLSARPIAKRPEKWPLGTRPGTRQRSLEAPNRTVIPFLASLNEAIWMHGKVKALVVLRNQPDWLASLYAERSNRIPGASQKDFEAQVEAMIRREDDFVAWSSWVDGLQQALGAENVCVLLIEDAGQRAFWNKLFDFLQLHELDPDPMACRSAPRERARRMGDGAWRLRPFDTDRITYGQQDRRLINARRLGLGLIRRAPRFIDRECLIRAVFDRKRDTQIEMTQRLREHIREYCRPFNDRLAEQLGRQDLEELGY